MEAQGLPELSSRRSRMLGDSSRRGVVLSTTSTVVVLAVLVGIFLLAPGSAQVRQPRLGQLRSGWPGSGLAPHLTA